MRRDCCLLFLALIWFNLATTFALAQSNNENPSNDRLRARVVLIVPAGATPPNNYRERLNSVAVRMENFIAKWMDHWGYSIEKPQFFERDSDGMVEVTLVKASLTKVEGRKSIPELHRLAVRGAKAALNIPRNRTVTWWIFYSYPDMEGFRGGGNALYGSAINRYPLGGDGPIDLESDLASPKLLTAQIKGSMHEFGHALGLPHTGPRLDLKLGNSLMGPVTNKYRRKTGLRDTRVYLSKSSAAILQSHPLFRSVTPVEPEIPKRVNIKKMSVKENRNGTFRVSGRLESDLTAHSAVVFDSAKSDFGGDYWAQSYVGKVDASGDFEVVVKKPSRKGKLYLAFCFDNGIVGADTKSPKIKKSSLAISYQGRKGKRKFDLSSGR